MSDCRQTIISKIFQTVKRTKHEVLLLANSSWKYIFVTKLSIGIFCKIKRLLNPFESFDDGEILVFSKIKFKKKQNYLQNLQYDSVSKCTLDVAYKSIFRQ